MTDEPFVINVAGLLGDGVGATRTIDIVDASVDLPDDLVLAEPISGRIRLTHENRGVVADVDLTTALAGECARCLRPLTTPIDIDLDGGVPAVGRPVDRASGAGDDEPDALRLTDHHELDLAPSVVDAISLAEPIAPLDRPDCPGLCMVCGLPLDEGTHDHPVDDIDPRLEALRGFVDDDEDDPPALIEATPRPISG